MLITEVATVVVPVAAVEVRQAAPYGTAELVRLTGGATACKGVEQKTHTVSFVLLTV